MKLAEEMKKLTNSFCNPNRKITLDDVIDLMKQSAGWKHNYTYIDNGRYICRETVEYLRKEGFKVRMYGAIFSFIKYDKEGWATDVRISW